MSTLSHREHRHFARETKKFRENFGTAHFIAPGKSLVVYSSRSSTSAASESSPSPTLPLSPPSAPQGREKTSGGRGVEGRLEEESGRQEIVEVRKEKGKSTEKLKKVKSLGSKEKRRTCKIFTWFQEDDSLAVRKRKTQASLDLLEEKHDELSDKIRDLEDELLESPSVKETQRISEIIVAKREDLAKTELELICLLDQMMHLYTNTENKCNKLKTRTSCERNLSCLFVPEEWSWNVVTIWKKLSGADPGTCRSKEKYELGLKLVNESVESLANFLETKIALEKKEKEGKILWKEKHELNKILWEYNNDKDKIQKHKEVMHRLVNSTKRLNQLVEELSDCQSKKCSEKKTKEIEQKIEAEKQIQDGARNQWFSVLKKQPWKKIILMFVSLIVLYNYVPTVKDSHKAIQLETDLEKAKAERIAQEKFLEHEKLKNAQLSEANTSRLSCLAGAAFLGVSGGTVAGIGIAATLPLGLLSATACAFYGTASPELDRNILDLTDPTVKNKS